MKRVQGRVQITEIGKKEIRNVAIFELEKMTRQQFLPKYYKN